MGFASKSVEKLRKIGRKVVLPTQEIQAILESKIDFDVISKIADISAGTLYWSEYFAHQLAQAQQAQNNANTKTQITESIAMDSTAYRGGGQNHKIANTQSVQTNNATRNQSPIEADARQTASQQTITQKEVIAIDSIYSRLAPQTTFTNIHLETDLFQAFEKYQFDMVFVSDVLHHLDSATQDKFLQNAIGTKIIAIKDIDVNHKLFNFANKMHDRIINGEKVRDIYPQEISKFLESNGYVMDFFELPKLWYSHFLLLGIKK